MVKNRIRQKQKITSKPQLPIRILQGIPVGVIVLISTASIVTLRFLTDEEINLSQIPNFNNHRPWIEALSKGLTVTSASLGDIAIVTAALLFIKEIPDRKDQKHYEAWQIIDNAAAAGMPTSQARVKAMQDLNEDDITLEGLDAPGADLSGIEIPGANLQGANLKGSDLRDSDLEGADLSEAYLCNLDNVSKGANLYNSNLNYANLKGAEIEKANLNEAKLQDSNLQGANLKEANLNKADFTRANLESADLSSADCSRAIFHLAKLKYANLSNVKNLTEAQLKTAWIYGTLLPVAIGIDKDRDRDKFSEIEESKMPSE